MLSLRVWWTPPDGQGEGPQHTALGWGSVGETVDLPKAGETLDRGGVEGEIAVRQALEDGGEIAIRQVPRGRSWGRDCRKASPLEAGRSGGGVR